MRKTWSIGAGKLDWTSGATARSRGKEEEPDSTCVQSFDAVSIIPGVFLRLDRGLEYAILKARGRGRLGASGRLASRGLRDDVSMNMPESVPRLLPSSRALD